LNTLSQAAESIAGTNEKKWRTSHRLIEHTEHRDFVQELDEARDEGWNMSCDMKVTTQSLGHGQSVVQVLVYTQLMYKMEIEETEEEDITV